MWRYLLTIDGCVSGCCVTQTEKRMHFSLTLYDHMVMVLELSSITTSEAVGICFRQLKKKDPFRYPIQQPLAKRYPSLDRQIQKYRYRQEQRQVCLYHADLEKKNCITIFRAERIHSLNIYLNKIGIHTLNIGLPLWLSW